MLRVSEVKFDDSAVGNLSPAKRKSQMVIEDINSSPVVQVQVQQDGKFKVILGYKWSL